MGKKVIGFALAIVGVALIATGVGAGLGTIALGAGLGSLSVATIIGTGLLIASSVLLGPKIPKMPGSLADGGRDRLYANLDPTTPRKFVFGNTAMATDVRYQTYSGTDQEYLHQIVCVASHEVQAIDEIWLDNEQAWTVGGGVLGRYAGYLTVATRTLGTSGNGIAIDSVWTANCTLTGCAYVHLRFKLTGNTTNVQSPFASGVTSRMTIRGKGAKVYDPRLDTTVAGGSGAHRANDQTTWAWSADASRNPALQELWYELGWKIASKLAVGKGVPPARIDLASYAVAANVCDESVTKVDLSTEPRYRSDGVLNEGDDPSAVREALCSTMNAVLRDAGGKLALTVLANDLGAPAASFNENDVLGSIDWQQTPELHAIFNIVRGRRIDPSDTTLYQPVDFAEVKLTSPDGIDRIDSIDYPLVQSNSQAQRLAKQRLQRNQYQGKIQLVGGPSWWQLNLGQVFQLTHSTFGWTNKLFRCAGTKISRSGQTDIVAVEENAAIYAWDKEEAAAVTPGAPTVYDPLNHPILSPPYDAVIGTNKPEDDATIDSNIALDDTVTIRALVTGVPKTGELSRVLAPKLMRLGAALTSGVTWAATLISGNATFTISGGGTGTFTITGPNNNTLALESVIRLSATYLGVARIMDVRVQRIDDPPTNAGGGGGTTVTSTYLPGCASTTYNGTCNSDIMTCKTGTAGQVACTAPVEFKRSVGTAAGTTGSYGKWKWRAVGGTFADITTEIAHSVVAETVTAEPPTQNYAGSLSVSMTKTTLTASTDYEFQFEMRKNNVSGTADDIYKTSGTFQCVGT